MQRYNKEYKIDICRYINICYGSVNKQDPRVIYISGKCWLEPTKVNDYCSVMKAIKEKFKENIKLLLANGKCFNETFILDFDINTDGMMPNTNKFLSFDFFLKQNGETQSLKDMRELLSRKLCTLIESFIYSCNKYGLMATVNKKK